MTLSAEDVYKFNKTLESMQYWDLWDCIDEDWKRLYDPTDPFSSWEEELMGMTYIEIRSRHKKMKPLELINKKQKGFYPRSINRCGSFGCRGVLT